ncbi:MAG: UMP kinase [Euryarchaeota archaeon]|nr:UMP kinase [Euryarchaeota archaeon]
MAEKVVISIGGSILASPKPNPGYIKDFAKMLKELRGGGILPMVVVGGGQVARDYIEEGRRLGATEELCDRMGILVTRLNAMLLVAALGQDAEEGVPVETGVYSGEKVLVMGGVKPGQTTDAVAARLAVVNNASLLVNATNVDGVYDSDPRENPEARLFERLSHQELLDIVGTGHRAGVSAVFDPTAASIVKEAGIKTLVVQGGDVQNIKNAVLGASFKGTTIE